MFAITLGSFVTSFTHNLLRSSWRPALRERLRTHKVFTKRAALYLNYPKLSYHVFTSLASHNLMISLENRRFKEPCVIIAHRLSLIIKSKNAIFKS